MVESLHPIFARGSCLREHACMSPLGAGDCCRDVDRNSQQPASPLCLSCRSHNALVREVVAQAMERLPRTPHSAAQRLLVGVDDCLQQLLGRLLPGAGSLDGGGLRGVCLKVCFMAIFVLEGLFLFCSALLPRFTCQTPFFVSIGACGLRSSWRMSARCACAVHISCLIP